MRVLHAIHGGIHPPENKHQSTTRPIRFAGLPDELVLPLSQHVGTPAKPLVAAGEAVLKGQCIAEAEGAISVPLHAPTSGHVVAVEMRPIPHPSGMADLCIVLRPDGEDRWIAHSGIEHWQQLAPTVLLQHIRDAGIAGMGGAGFPSAIKLAPRQPIDTLLINGAECEPYITADDMLMRERAADIVTGIHILQHIIQPRSETLIGIEDNKPEAVQALQAATAGTDIKVVVIPTRYPSGGEKQLIQIITGLEVPSGGLPADIGVICQNVGTAAAICKAVVHGEPLLSRITTVTGNACREPQNFEVLLGTPIQWLLDASGFDSRRCSRLIIGGPMMGYTVEQTNMPVIKTTNCILAPTAEELPPPPPAQACIRCGLCAEACPASLLPQQLYWFARGQEWEKLEAHRIFDCIECGACSYVCPSHIPLVQYYRAGKAELRQQAKTRINAEHAKARFEARQERLAREEAEREARRRQRQQAARASADESGDSDPIQAAIARAEAKRAARQITAEASDTPPSSPPTQANADTEVTAAVEPEDTAQAAIARALAQRASQGTQSPREQAQQRVAGLQKRLARSRDKLTQAQAEGSEHVELLTATVAKLEQQLEAASQELTEP